MVYHYIGTTHPDAINVAEDYVTNRGSRDCDEVGSFTSWRNGGWYEPDLVAIGESYYSVVGYQEGKRSP